MSVRIIAELPVKPESVSDMKSLMKEILPDTRAFEGCNKIDVYSNSENESIIVLVEDWDSPEHYERYHEWRVETGVIGKLREMLAGPVRRQFLNRVDV